MSRPRTAPRTAPRNGPGRRGWRPTLAIALAAGVVVGVLVGGLGVRGPEPLPPPGDRVRAAVDGLRDDPFFVAPELADRLTDEEREAVSDALGDAGAPTYVIWWSGTREAGYADDREALEQVAAALGDGRYTAVDETLSATDHARGYDEPYLDPDLLLARPDAALLAWATALADAPPEDEERFDYWGGPLGGTLAGLLFGTGGYLGLLVVVGVVGVLTRGRRTPRSDPRLAKDRP